MSREPGRYSAQARPRHHPAAGKPCPVSGGFHHARIPRRTLTRGAYTHAHAARRHAHAHATADSTQPPFSAREHARRASACTRTRVPARITLTYPALSNDTSFYGICCADVRDRCSHGGTAVFRTQNRRGVARSAREGGGRGMPRLTAFPTEDTPVRRGGTPVQASRALRAVASLPLCVPRRCCWPCCRSRRGRRCRRRGSWGGDSRAPRAWSSRGGWCLPWLPCARCWSSLRQPSYTSRRARAWTGGHPRPSCAACLPSAATLPLCGRAPFLCCAPPVWRCCPLTLLPCCCATQTRRGPVV